MKKFLLGAVAVASVLSMYGAQVAPAKPEETLIHSKIIERRDNGRLRETYFYLVKEPQPGKKATYGDIVAYIKLEPRKNKDFYLAVLQVAEEYRERLGYGSLLLNLLKEYLLNYGAERLSGRASPFGLKSGQSKDDMLPKLIGFYESQGGKNVGPASRLSVDMEVDLKPFGKIRQLWLPESPDVLPKGRLGKNIEIINVSDFTGFGHTVNQPDSWLDGFRISQQALTSPAPLVIINIDQEFTEKSIKSKL